MSSGQTPGFLLQKACGECTECCKGPLPVPELDIDEGKPCRHLCESGCGDYENRLEVCHIFSCVWKTNFVKDSLRPDRSGIICKWVDDGSMLLVPTKGAAPIVAVEQWKAFAKKHNQALGLYDRESKMTETLVRKRERAIA